MRGLGIAVLCIALLATPLAQALPTPGFFGEEARTATGRLFPEATQTNDYVGIWESIENLQLLEEENPELVTFHQITNSTGWENIAGGHDTLPVFAITLTNKQSAIADEDKINLLFMLSIHGNEKGGREGGMRVIEDFTKAWNADDDTGVATDERLGMLDYMRLIFLFPNPDGWAHELAEYRHNDAGYISLGGVETQNFVRVNGNGLDLNRQAPTQGWSRGEGAHASLSQAESQGYIPWLNNAFPEIDYASDLHGMLYPANALVNSSRPIHCFPPEEAPDNPVSDATGEVCLREGNFVLTMIPAGQFTPREELIITALAERIEERLNTDPYFTEWNTLPGAGVWGGEYNGWGTVWDTIGYVDSGFSSDWFAQDTGLDAPGVDFEFSYNHIMFDNYYPGLAQRINDYHVETTRVIVAAFMDIAALNTHVSIDSQDTRTAYVPTRVVATDADNGNLTGWAAENEADDAYDWENGIDYEATINDYFREIAPTLSAGDVPGVLDPIEPEELTELLTNDAYDNLVIPGSAVRPILESPGQAEAVRSFVEAGGHLLATDEAIQLLATFGVVDNGTIDQAQAYAGYTNWIDRDHHLATNVRGLARQLFEPMPLGFQEGITSPVWTVQREALENAGGTAVGAFSPNKANLGEIPVGNGTITLIGALLPDPTEDYYHPYGLASYATTYTGNQVVRNALGWQMTFEQPPRVTEAGIILDDEDPSRDEPVEPANTTADQDDDSNGVPGIGLLPLLVVASALALVVRRVRRA